MLALYTPSDITPSMLLRLFKIKPTFDFMGKRWIGFAVSLALTAVSLGLVFTKGLNMGIDFTGGVLMEIRTEQVADLGKLRDTLNGQGLGEVSLQDFGDAHDLIIRIQTAKGTDQAAVVAKVRTLLTQHVQGGIDFRKIDYVGPTVGAELVQAGMLAVLIAFAVIIL